MNVYQPVRSRPLKSEIVLPLALSSAAVVMAGARRGADSGRPSPAAIGANDRALRIGVDSVGAGLSRRAHPLRIEQPRASTSSRAWYPVGAAVSSAASVATDDAASATVPMSRQRQMRCLRNGGTAPGGTGR